MGPDKIGQTIKQARKKQNFTQAEAAGYLDVGPRFLSDLENGKPTVQLGKAIAVIEGLGFEVMLVPKKRKDLIRQVKEALDAG